MLVKLIGQVLHAIHLEKLGMIPYRCSCEMPKLMLDSVQALVVAEQASSSSSVMGVCTRDVGRKSGVMTAHLADQAQCLPQSAMHQDDSGDNEAAHVAKMHGSKICCLKLSVDQFLLSSLLAQVSAAKIFLVLPMLY